MRSSLITVLVLTVAAMLLWYAVKGEKPIALIRRSFKDGKK